MHQHIQCKKQLYNVVCNLDNTVILCSWSVLLTMILFDLSNYTSFLGNYQQALETYKTIHKRFPDNVECKCYYWKSEEKAKKKLCCLVWILINVLIFIICLSLRS